MGHRTFSILAAISRFGVVIIRNFEIVVIADSPALACGLIVATMFPTLILPLILSGMQKLNVWIADRRGRRRPPEHNRAEAVTLVVRDRSEKLGESLTDVLIGFRDNRGIWCPVRSNSTSHILRSQGSHGMGIARQVTQLQPQTCVVKHYGNEAGSDRRLEPDGAIVRHKNLSRIFAEMAGNHRQVHMTSNLYITSAGFTVRFP
ncbi:hypothetical protein EDC04DRAFT_2716186 [Pisolithus marmoratus]|nr:hypothetical protein EDC04DRAFT_2716186 [Pisolithus marmoratus]